MANMTPNPIDALADQALKLKIAVGEFRNTFFTTLTQDQRDGLQTLANQLGDQVDHLTAGAIRLSLDDLQDALSHLSGITAGVNDAVAHLGDVRKVLTAATSLVDLGAAIASKDPGTLLAALNATVTAIKS